MRPAMRSLALVVTTTVVLATPLAAQPFLSGPEIPLFSDESEQGWDPSLAAAPDGGFAAVWSRWDGILVARVFAADGSPLTASAARISPDDGFSNAHVWQKLAALSTGGYAAVWSRVSPVGYATGLLRILDPTGQPAGPVIELDPQPLSQGEVIATSITADATGHFVVGWQAPDGAIVRRFGADGAPATPEILIAGPGAMPHVAAFTDGRFVVGSPAAGGYVDRIFGPAGNPLNPPFNVRGGADFQISAAADRFVTLWTERGSTTNSVDRIVARLWGVGGNPLGPEIVVTETWRDQEVWFSQVAMRGDGSFMVVWQAPSTMARLFDSKGRPAGKPLRLAQTTSVGINLEAAGNDWVLGWPTHLLPDHPSTVPSVQRLTAPCGCSLRKGAEAFTR